MYFLFGIEEVIYKNQEPPNAIFRMNSFLLNLRLHSSSKVRIMDSLNSLVTNNNFRDVFITCSDGSVSLDKLTFGILFPFLGDLFKGTCSSDVFISMPDYNKMEIIEAVNRIVGKPVKQSNTEDIKEGYDSSSIDYGTISEIILTNPAKNIRKKKF